METIIDPLTGQSFQPSRSNQRFANRANQIRYNNRQAAKRRKEKAGVDKKLDKNRAILKAMLGDKQEVTRSKDYLLGAGFSFQWLTHHVRQGETLWYCIYDVKYALVGTDQYKISR